jgi:hypothetical protein
MSTDLLTPRTSGTPGQASSARAGSAAAASAAPEQLGRRPARPARRPGRPDRPASPVNPASPRPASPARPAGPGRPGRTLRTGQPRQLAPETARPQDEDGGGSRLLRRAGAVRAGQLGRTSFVMLLLGLLGGSLVCLLVVNTTLAANSIEISNLRQANAAKTQRAQEIAKEVTAARSPGVIEKEAWRLGMRTDPALTFLDVRRGTIRTGSDAAGGSAAASGPRQ